MEYSHEKLGAEGMVLSRVDRRLVRLETSLSPADTLDLSSDSYKEVSFGLRNRFWAVNRTAEAKRTLEFREVFAVRRGLFGGNIDHLLG